MIKLEDLSYWYPRMENPSLDRVNLEINDGEFVLILGASGSGKSTLLYSFNGILQHEIGGRIKGHIEVNGKNPTKSEVYEMATTISLVMQDPEAQLTQMTVWDEVVFGPENLLRPKEEIIKDAEAALKFVGLYDKRDCIVAELSGGQKQRLAIAAALAMNSEIIAMDEPTAHLDPRGTKEVFQVIKKLRELKKTLILVEHKVDDIIELVEDSDRVIVVDGGKIVLNGRCRDILANHGKDIMEKYGLYLPQIVELSLRLGIKPMPLRMREVDYDKFGLQPRKPERKKKAHETLIRVEDLEFSYDNGSKVLKNINLSIPRGITTAIVGHNGSGKSTLLQNIIGLLKPTKGRIVLNGVDLHAINRKDVFRDIGYVFQYPEHQFVTKTVKDEIEYGLKIRNVEKTVIEVRSKDMLHMFGLERMVDRHPLTLSMGEKRRLSFATMLILEPKVLIMDEPVVGQDKRSTEHLISLIGKLKEQGITVVIATHDMNFLAMCADNVIVIDNGQIVFQGDVIDLFNRREILEASGLDDPPVHKIAVKLGCPEIVTTDQFCSELVKEVIR
ncbi:MAG: ABC transporter ATP-binding protein [Nitrososphaeria archaeon]